MSSPSQKNKMQARDLGSYLVTKKAKKLHWTCKYCDDRQLNEVCEEDILKLYFKRGIT